MSCFHPLVKKITNNTFWHAVCSNNKHVGPGVVSNCITLRIGESQWNTPIISHILKLKVPISFIHGQNDWIVPVSHVQLLVDCLEDVTCYVMKNTGHNPARTNKKFPSVVCDAVRNASIPNENAFGLGELFEKESWKWAVSSVSSTKSSIIIEQLTQ